jgi:hypothetical protein
MPRYDDFYVTQRDGEWKIYIRSSPEDMDEYDLETGLREIIKRMRAWRDRAQAQYEAMYSAEQKARDLESRIEEGLRALKPLLDAGLIDETDLFDE